MVIFANEIKFSVNEGHKLNLALLSNAKQPLASCIGTSYKSEA